MVVGCVQAMVWKNLFLVQFEDGQNKYMSSFSLVFLCSKEEVDMDEPLSHYPEKEQGELLTIVWDPGVGEPCMFGKGVYLYVFYCLGYVKEMSTHFSEDQVSNKRDPYLNK